MRLPKTGGGGVCKKPDQKSFRDLEYGTNLETRNNRMYELSQNWVRT